MVNMGRPEKRMPVRPELPRQRIVFALPERPLSARLVEHKNRLAGSPASVFLVIFQQVNVDAELCAAGGKY
jgi:hypothetical protein